MNKHLKTVIITAGIVLIVTATAIAISRMGTTAEPQEFILFRQIRPGEDPMEVAKGYMGDSMVENKGFFSTDFRVLDDPGITGMFV